MVAADGRYGRLLLTAGLVGLVLSWSAIRMTAQITTAGIAGLVADQGGAVIPGVTVTAREVATGFTRSTTSLSNLDSNSTNKYSAAYRLVNTRRGRMELRVPLLEVEHGPVAPLPCGHSAQSEKKHRGLVRFR